MYIIIFFLQLYFSNILSLGPRLIFKNKEINKNIKYKLPYKDQLIINKINGFFGNIGPDIPNNSNLTLYDLFTGNGNIQSVFLNNGNITFVKHIIRTEKVLYEENNGIIPNNIIIKLFFTILNKFKLLPNILGLANTALLNINNNIYALYERDKPYLINIDLKNNKILTFNKINNLSINHFSAHSKYNKTIKTIKTIDYNLFSKSLSIYELTENFNIIKKINIKMDYLPIIHDFWDDYNKTIIINSPLKFNFKKIFTNFVPIYLDNTKNTIINIYDKKNNKITKYYTNESFFIFHFANLIEDENYINIFASLYNKLDFNEINITGRYRKIIIEKKTGNVLIEKNNILENYSVDFPVKFNNKILLRNMNNNSFIICKDLKIIKEIYVDKLKICGEPIINYINYIPYIITFAYNTTHSYLLVINSNNNKIIKISLNFKLNFGFHSIFIKK
jgi:hypothetical protein